MENASKALLIAGAVLVALLIISIGLGIYRGSKGVLDQGTTAMSAQEIQTFNAKFLAYEGNNVSGTNVKALKQEVIANNLTNDLKVKYNGSELNGSATTSDILSSDRYTVTLSYTNGYVSGVTATKK